MNLPALFATVWGFPQRMVVVLLRRSPLGRHHSWRCASSRGTCGCFFGGSLSISSTSTTLSLNGMVQWGHNGGHANMDSCRTVAPYGTMAALMAGLVRASLWFITSDMGWREEVEVTSRVCAQGDFFGLYRGVGDGGGKGARPCPIL
jgi:hypothetical protein